jgi:hypothetical protein
MQAVSAQVWQSTFNIARLAPTLRFADRSFLGCMSGLQVAAQPHVQGDGNAHYD